MEEQRKNLIQNKDEVYEFEVDDDDVGHKSK